MDKGGNVQAPEQGRSRFRRSLGGTVGTLAVGLVLAPAALACHNSGGETRFNFNLPGDVKVKATKGAEKQGPSRIVMGNCGGNFDPATGAGGIYLVGGFVFKYENNRGPTGAFRISYGPGGKLRGRVAGVPGNIAKVQGGRVVQPAPGVTRVEDARLKLTSKGANSLNGALEAGTGGPFTEGSFGRVTSVVN